MGMVPLASWSFTCNCRGHSDTLQCIVCIALVCLVVLFGNEKGCPLPAIWLAGKCGLRKCGEREKYKVCANLSLFFYPLFV